MTDQERITALEARIAQLESRLAMLESKAWTFPIQPMQPPPLQPWQPCIGGGHSITGPAWDYKVGEGAPCAGGIVTHGSGLVTGGKAAETVVN